MHDVRQSFPRQKRKRRPLLQFRADRFVRLRDGKPLGGVPAPTREAARHAQPFAKDKCFVMNGLRLLNPGSPTERRRAPAHTLAVVDIDAGALRTELEAEGIQCVVRNRDRFVNISREEQSMSPAHRFPGFHR